MSAMHCAADSCRRVLCGVWVKMTLGSRRRPFVVDVRLLRETDSSMMCLGLRCSATELPLLECLAEGPKKTSPLSRRAEAFVIAGFANRGPTNTTYGNEKDRLLVLRPLDAFIP